MTGLYDRSSNEDAQGTLLGYCVTGEIALKYYSVCECHPALGRACSRALHATGIPGVP